jgi:hypothetical protein
LELKIPTAYVGSRWADPVNKAIARYLEAGGIKVVGIYQEKSVGVGLFRHDSGTKAWRWHSMSAVRPQKLGPKPMPSQCRAALQWHCTSFRLKNSANLLSPT